MTMACTSCWSDEELQYDLQAVLIHRGPSANSGHYISYICDSTSNLWFKFNDEDIAQMGGKNLQLGNEDELHLSGVCACVRVCVC